MSGARRRRSSVRPSSIAHQPRQRHAGEPDGAGNTVRIDLAGAARCRPASARPVDARRRASRGGRRGTPPRRAPSRRTPRARPGRTGARAGAGPTPRRRAAGAIRSSNQPTKRGTERVELVRCDGPTPVDAVPGVPAAFEVQVELVAVHRPAGHGLHRRPHLGVRDQRGVRLGGRVGRRDRPALDVVVAAAAARRPASATGAPSPAAGRTRRGRRRSATGAAAARRPPPAAARRAGRRARSRRGRKRPAEPVRRWYCHGDRRCRRRPRRTRRTATAG